MKNNLANFLGNIPLQPSAISSEMSKGIIKLHPNSSKQPSKSDPPKIETKIPPIQKPQFVQAVNIQKPQITKQNSSNNSTYSASCSSKTGNNQENNVNEGWDFSITEVFDVDEIFGDDMEKQSDKKQKNEIKNNLRDSIWDMSFHLFEENKQRNQVPPTKTNTNSDYKLLSVIKEEHKKNDNINGDDIGFDDDEIEGLFNELEQRGTEGDAKKNEYNNYIQDYSKVQPNSSWNNYLNQGLNNNNNNNNNYYYNNGPQTFTNQNYNSSSNSYSNNNPNKSSNQPFNYGMNYNYNAYNSNENQYNYNKNNDNYNNNSDKYQPDYSERIVKPELKQDFIQVSKINNMNNNINTYNSNNNNNNNYNYNNQNTNNTNNTSYAYNNQPTNYNSNANVNNKVNSIINSNPYINQPLSKNQTTFNNEPFNNNNNTNSNNNNSNSRNGNNDGQVGANPPFSKNKNKEVNEGENFIEKKCSNHTLADLNFWSKPFSWDDDVSETNIKIFGNRKFRPNQREIINANLDNRDIFVCMPTGGGKSLTFQVPAIIQYGVTWVVMPLLSLIQDQTSFLTGLGIRVLFLNSDGSKEVFQNYDSWFHNTNDEEFCKLIFLTPEKIAQSPKTISLLERWYSEKLLVRCVIDECHCVSQWGREFRPDYLNLKILKRKFPNLPIWAITATAPNKIREDIINQWGMINTLFFRSSYNRTNWYIEIRNKKEVKNVVDDMANWIQTEYPNSSGWIYCSSKNNCEKIVSTWKQKYRINCAFYHAGMAEKNKNDIQEKWKNDEIRIIVATVAFGMGINKADVRFVIHHSMPKSFEGYYQEIGRAGRDGNYSKCILYYNAGDRKIIEFLMSKTNLQPQMMIENLRKTTEMIEYCEECFECRRVIAWWYFDEKFSRKLCNKMCDNCMKNLRCEDKDVTNESVVILDFLKNCYYQKIEITISGMVDYLRGIKLKGFKKLPNNDNNQHMLKAWNQSNLRKIIRRLVIWKYIDEHLVVNGDKVYSRVEISQMGLEYLRNHTSNPTRNKPIVWSFWNKNKKSQDNNSGDSEHDDEEELNACASKNNQSTLKKQTSVNINNDGKWIEKNKNKNDSDIKHITDRKRKKNQRKSSKSNISFNQDDHDEEDDDVNDDYGLCNESEFNDLFNQLKMRRVVVLNEENAKLAQNNGDNKYKRLEWNDIFTNNGLKELCRKWPLQESELTKDNIFGIGKNVLKKYGKEFLQTIQRHVSAYSVDIRERKDKIIQKSLKKCKENKKQVEQTGNNQKDDKKNDNQQKNKDKNNNNNNTTTKSSVGQDSSSNVNDINVDDFPLELDNILEAAMYNENDFIKDTLIKQETGWVNDQYGKASSLRHEDAIDTKLKEKMQFGYLDIPDDIDSWDMFASKSFDWSNLPSVTHHDQTEPTDEYRWREIEQSRQNAIAILDQKKVKIIQNAKQLRQMMKEKKKEKEITEKRGRRKVIIVIISNKSVCGIKLIKLGKIKKIILNPYSLGQSP